MNLGTHNKKYFISLTVVGFLVISISLAIYNKHAYSEQVLEDKANAQQLETFLEHKSTAVTATALKDKNSYTAKDVAEASNELKQDLKIVLNHNNPQGRTQKSNSTMHVKASVGFYSKK
ncbi:hypothetical protein [Lactococcus taiwanensis]|uniref:hypothetical protein n=1 Tax=Lactococcus taiwanensis TaxID=1151742 RepID=UPI0035193CE4